MTTPLSALSEQGFEGDYAAIPAHMQDSLLLYVKKGKMPGHFLRAVLSNDLSGAVGHADADNLALLPVYVRWLYNVAPFRCHGSWDTMKEWFNRGGLEGPA